MATLLSDALIDIDYFATMLDVDIQANTEDETRAILCINFVSSMFNSFCNRILVARDYSYDPTETDAYDESNAIFDGPSGNTFWFPTYPVNSISEFIVSDVVIPAASSYNSSAGYHLYGKQGKLIYYGGFDFGYPQNVKIKWNGGYTASSPEMSELRFLCYQVSRDMYLKLDDTGSSLKSETIGTYSYQNFSPNELKRYRSLHPIAFNLLSMKYRREVIA